MSNEAWYDAFYGAVETSNAYARFCKETFGRDFSQQGFSNMEQISFMLDRAGLKQGGKVLDIGCGNGRMIEYIADTYGINGFGFDISTAAIEFAQRRTAGKKERLSFRAGSINDIEYETQSFDAVLSVDTLYFADDMKKTVSKILSWIKPGGCFAAFFCEFRFKEDDPMDKLTMYGTGLALSMQEIGIPYDACDFTESHYHVMHRKRDVLLSMKQDFSKEGTDILYENAFAESIDEDICFEDFKKFSSRYLYIVKA